jgi:hypothetical protein
MNNMALPLTDLPSIKVHPEVHCLLKANATVNQKDVNALVREILHEWALRQFHVFSMATDLAKAKELSGITGDWQ